MIRRHFRSLWHAAMVAGLLLMRPDGALALSCSPESMPASIYGTPLAQADLALHRVRSNLAHQESVFEGRIVEITNDAAAWNWRSAKLARLQVTRSYKGNLTGEIQVLLPYAGGQQTPGKGKELLVFVSRETQAEALGRSDWVKHIGPKWAQDQTRFLTASPPCLTLVYDKQDHPGMFQAVRTVFAGPHHAQLLIDVRITAPGDTFESTDSELGPPRLDLTLKRLEAGGGEPVAVRMNQEGNRRYGRTSATLDPGTYEVAASPVAGTQLSCLQDLGRGSAQVDCNSMILLSHAAHSLSIRYVPSAKVNLALTPDFEESMPIEFEFVPMQPGLNKVAYVSGIVGNLATLYPGKYQLQMILTRPDKSRQVTKLLLNSQASAELRPGVQRLEVSGFPPSKLATTSFIKPSTDGADYSIWPRLLTSNGTFRSPSMGCEGVKCTVKGLDGQYIEIQENKAGAPVVSAIFKLGEPTVQLPLTSK